MMTDPKTDDTVVNPDAVEPEEEFTELPNFDAERGLGEFIPDEKIAQLDAEGQEIFKGLKEAAVELQEETQKKLARLTSASGIPTDGSDKTFSELLADYIALGGISPRTFAKALGVNRNRIVKIAEGKVQATAEEERKIKAMVMLDAQKACRKANISIDDVPKTLGEIYMGTEPETPAK